MLGSVRLLVCFPHAVLGHLTSNRVFESAILSGYAISHVKRSQTNKPHSVWPCNVLNFSKATALYFHPCAIVALSDSFGKTNCRANVSNHAVSLLLCHVVTSLYK